MSSLNTIYNIASLTYLIITGQSLISADGYRPSQWGSSGNSSNMVKISSNIGGFFADAVFGFSVEKGNTITSHPIQNGANISDHVINNPAKINVELGISDAMGCYTNDGYSIDSLEADLAAAIRQKHVSMDGYKEFTAHGVTSYYSKSASALMLLLYMAEANVPFSVRGVKPIIYNNMIIENLSWTEDASSLYSIRVNLSLIEVMTVEVAQDKVSARDWATGSGSNNGEVQGVEDESTWAKAKGDGETGLRNK